MQGRKGKKGRKNVCFDPVRRNHGFILIEGMVALLLLTIGALVFAQVHAHVAHCQRMIAEQVACAGEVRSYLEKHYAGLSTGSIDGMRTERIDTISLTVQEGDMPRQAHPGLVRFVRFVVPGKGVRSDEEMAWVMAVVEK